jgi:uncharacterized protein (DUF362 family)
MVESRVSITQTPPNPDYEQILAGVEKAMDLLGGIKDIVKPGQKVMIKPNLAVPRTNPEQAAITLPEVSRAVADLVKGTSARPIIAESSGVGVDTEKIIAESGYQLLREMGYEVIDLRQTELTTLPVANGKIFQKIRTYKLVKEADVIIPVAKLKTHDDAGLTLTIKNLKGLLADSEKKKFHKQGLFQACVDWFSVLKPKLAIVDAIYGMEGLGPAYGSMVELDLIIAGRNLVAVDAVCGYITGFEPHELPILDDAAKRAMGPVGRDEIEVVGKSIASVFRRFQRYEEDDALKVEGFNLLYGDFTCTGCWLTIAGALVDIKQTNRAHYLRNVTIVNFDVDIPDDINKEGVVTVGSCISRNKRGECHVEGCPPRQEDLVEAIVSTGSKVNKQTE